MPRRRGGLQGRHLRTRGLEPSRERLRRAAWLAASTHSARSAGRGHDRSAIRSGALHCVDLPPHGHEASMGSCPSVPVGSANEPVVLGALSENNSMDWSRPLERGRVRAQLRSPRIAKRSSRRREGRPEPAPCGDDRGEGRGTQQRSRVLPSSASLRCHRRDLPRHDPRRPPRADPCRRRRRDTRWALLGGGDELGLPVSMVSRLLARQGLTRAARWKLAGTQEARPEPGPRSRRLRES